MSGCGGSCSHDGNPNKATCANCGAKWNVDQLKIPSDSFERQADDAAGECPDCGALAYEDGIEVDKKSDAEFLRQVAEKLRHVPVMFGLDGYHIDRLEEIAASFDTQ